MTTRQTTSDTVNATTERMQDGLLVAIVLLVGGMAGAASFSHVHDWTMQNSPTGTGDWFGWANAVISELIPVAALIVIGRRRRNRQPIGYPTFLLVVAVGLSLTAQLAVAKPTVFGWMVSALPALAFFALSKLVFTATTPRPDSPVPAPNPAAMPAATATEPEPAAPEPHTPSADPTPIPAHLLPPARFAVVNHQHTTGRPITANELANRLSIAPAEAGQLLAAVTGTPHAVNGTPLGGAR